MARATVQSLTQAEQALIAETAPGVLAALDEDGLIALLDRVRRARTKVVALHRREVAGAVAASKARGLASDAPRRSASKAEIFEQALARVSAALARAARRSAAELRDERLAAAASGQGSRPAADSSAADTAMPPSPKRGATRRPVERKTTASTRAAGARRQAARDKRN